MIRRRSFLPLLLMILVALAASAGALEDELLTAVRKSDVAGVKAAIAKGANVNFKYRYDRSALSFACDRGNLEVVKLLLDAGAEINAKDSFYGATPLDWAAYKGSPELIRLLLDKGATGKESVLRSAVQQGQLEVLKVVLEKGGLRPETLNTALAMARRDNKPDIIAALIKAGAVEPPKPSFQVAPEILQKYAGTYRNEKLELNFGVKDGALAGNQGGQGFTLSASDKATFQVNESPGITVVFNWDGEKVVSLIVKQDGSDTLLKKVEGK